MESADAKAIIAALDDISKMLGVLLSRDCDTQSEVIVELSDVKMESGRIAHVLGAKPDSVRKAINRAKNG
jgi:hypothetical protein